MISSIIIIIFYIECHTKKKSLKRDVHMYYKFSHCELIISINPIMLENSIMKLIIREVLKIVLCTWNNTDMCPNLSKDVVSGERCTVG